MPSVLNPQTSLKQNLNGLKRMQSSSKEGKSQIRGRHNERKTEKKSREKGGKERKTRKRHIQRQIYTGIQFITKTVWTSYS